MLYVKFNLGDYRYVMPIDIVIEIIPQVKLKKITDLPEYFSGICKYRGHSLPVIDLCRLILKRPCNKKLSTRIIIVKIIKNKSKDIMFGLMVERATEIIKEDPDSFMDASVYGENMPYTGPVLADSLGLISLVSPFDIHEKIDDKIFIHTLDKIHKSNFKS